MNPILLVLAAGMGSRYGGLKRMDGLGPNGETIIGYSIYDAVKPDSAKWTMSYGVFPLSNGSTR